MAWFGRGRNDPASFERDLRELARQITTNERYSSRLQLRYLSVRRLLAVYSWIGYAIWLAVVAVSARRGERPSWLKLASVPVVPGTIILVLRLLSHYQRFFTARQEAYVAKLRERHELKIEQLKEATNFEATHLLLRKFGDGEDYDMMVEEEKQLVQQQQQRLEELRRQQERGEFDVGAASAAKHRTWSDRLMDMVLGDDANDPLNRYALICARCKAHNGLAPPGKTPPEIEYVCPLCGFRNNAGPVPDGVPQMVAIKPAEGLTAVDSDAEPARHRAAASQDNVN